MFSNVDKRGWLLKHARNAGTFVFKSFSLEIDDL